MLLIAAAAGPVPWRASRMYISVPRAHHVTGFGCRERRRLRAFEASLASGFMVSRADRGLTNGGTEEGHGSGTLGIM